MLKTEPNIKSYYDKNEVSEEKEAEQTNEVKQEEPKPVEEKEVVQQPVKASVKPSIKQMQQPKEVSS